MKNESATDSEFLREEKRVEARIGEFKEEPGLSDPVLTQILFIVGLPWMGVAANRKIRTSFVARGDAKSQLNQATENN